MNYVELHIGDYDKDTAHLSEVQDGIYGRLLRRYYTTEAPLPNDIPALCRLVRAHTPAGKRAVKEMLTEFFLCTDSGFRHKRCDEEIAKVKAKQDKARESANARWNASGRNANASPNALRTQSEGNAHQSPVTSHQSPEASTNTIAREDLQAPDTLPGRACKAMRGAGLHRTNPSDPRLIEALTAGVTPEQLADLVRETPGKAMAWYIAAAMGRRRDAVEQGRGIAPGAPAPAPVDPLVAWTRERNREHENRLIAIRHRRDVLGLDPAEAERLITEAKDQHRELLERGPEAQAA